MTPRKTIWGWLIAGTLVLVLVFVGPLAIKSYRDALGIVETPVRESNTQVISALTRTQEVSLLSLGIQGIAERSAETTVFGVRLPGSQRALFLQYSFNAKLGMDGSDVRITQVRDDIYRIEIPEFIFIGHDDIEFKLVTEDKGVLSFVTPEIDTIEMTNSVLNDDARRQYLVDNDDLLREQAEAFYNGIVAAIDPDIWLQFDYASRR